MNIEVTPLAERRLEEHLGGSGGVFRLFYDTEGCGCDGISVLQMVSEPSEHDLTVASNKLSFVVDRQQQIFFNESLRLDADPNYPSFSLRSDSMTYGKNVKAVDLRGAAVVPNSSAACSLNK